MSQMKAIKIAYTGYISIRDLKIIIFDQYLLHHSPLNDL